MPRFLLAILALLGVLAWAIVVEVGINAGRVHEGVNVGHVDVSGLTLLEAQEVLKQEGEMLRAAPVSFGLATQPLNLHFLPADVGWTPEANATAEQAMRVGRDEAPFGALADRLRAWFGGVEIEWAGHPRAKRVTELIDAWEEQAEALGVTIWRGRLRARIRRAIETWPRPVLFRIPVIEG